MVANAIRTGATRFPPAKEERMSETTQETQGVTRTIKGIEAPGPGTWEIDPVHTDVTFVARYMMLTKVRGRFDEFSGAIHVAENPEDSWVEVTIQTPSINTNQEMRDNHLKSGDFLLVDEFPTITFRSTKVELLGGSNLRVTGDLTIRGATREVVLDAEFVGLTPKDMRGNARAAFTASTAIDREDFGVLWNMALETGGVLVSKKVDINIEAQAVLKTAEEVAA
jgi:polyisoprenoid-binding protein YceI